MTKFKIDTYQHLNSNPFNYKDTTPIVAVNIEIFDINQECFPICKVGMYYHKHHLTAYMMSMRSLEILYPSTSSSLWELIPRMQEHSENYSKH
jgi:hypothetical protein